MTTLRLVHVPTIVSMCQLEGDAERAASAVPTSNIKEVAPLASALPPAPAAPSVQTSDSATLPLAGARGQPVPLYLYPAARLFESQSNQDDVGEERDSDAGAVPEDGNEMTAWDLETDACMPGVTGMACKPQPTPLATSGYSWDMTAMVVPSPSALTRIASQLSDGVLSASDLEPYTAGRSLAPRSSFAAPHMTAMMYDDDDLAYEADTGFMASAGAVSASAPSRTSSIGSDMDISPRPSGPPSLASPRGGSESGAPSVLETVLTALWDDCAARGLFRYDVTQCASRVVPGRWGWFAQLNEGRSSKKRPTELRADAVLQPFDSGKFNFSKAFLREVLLEFEPTAVRAGAAGGWVASAEGARLLEAAPMSDDPTLVMINVSPIDYGHVLLVPRVLAQQPQQLHHDALASALAFVREVGSPSFRLGYNSLGAYATINHLHFQGYFQATTLPVERATTRPLLCVAGASTLHVAELADYPVRGWVITHRRGVDPVQAEADMAGLLARVCGGLQAQDQPFNVLMVDQGRRVFIWPQCYAERQAAGVVPVELLDTGVNPAVFEVAGHLVLKRAEDYDGATDAWAARLLAGVSLPAARFDALTASVFGTAPPGAKTLDHA